jgi:hypothetical protein
LDGDALSPMETALVVSNNARRLCRAARSFASQSAHESGWLYRMIDKPFSGLDLTFYLKNFFIVSGNLLIH